MARDVQSGWETKRQSGHGTSRLMDDIGTVFAGLHSGARAEEVHAALREKLSTEFAVVSGRDG
jgi:hypothetical protein